jgi:hypothetical protein
LGPVWILVSGLLLLWCGLTCKPDLKLVLVPFCSEQAEIWKCPYS